MDTKHLLEQFNAAASRLDSHALRKKDLVIEVGHWLNSVVLRLSKPRWSNKPLTRPQADTAIFFSVWTNNDHRLLYNIHALKLRKLQGYKLESRKFAEAFRAKFASYAHYWPNVSVDFGSLTLMEGWKDTTDPESDVAALAARFLEIDHLIDELLDNAKKTGSRQKKGEDPVR
jgi:hypothetical protein